jgi:hypothetical protein
MKSREHYELFRYLMERHCLYPEDMQFVENIADWCRKNGIAETDGGRPFKIISKEDSGCRVLIKEEMSDKTINERINGLRVRSQLKSVAFDRADLLDSDGKKLAYLFLSEFALSLPDVQDDFAADDWSFDEMERLGFFKNRKGVNFDEDINDQRGQF